MPKTWEDVPWTVKSLSRSTHYECAIRTPLFKLLPHVRLRAYGCMRLIMYLYTIISHSPFPVQNFSNAKLYNWLIKYLKSLRKPRFHFSRMYQEFQKTLLNLTVYRELPAWEGPKHREETTWGSWVLSTQSAVNLRQLSRMQIMNPPQRSLRHLLHLIDLMKLIDPQL